MKTKTWVLEEVEEKLQEIDGHTQVKIMRDNGVELVECIGTRCEHQDSLLQEQREMVGSLKVDYDQVGPVGPNEVERVSDANGSMQRLGGSGGFGIPCEDSHPRCDCPRCDCPGVCEWCGCVEMCVKRCVECECHGVRECMRGIGTWTDPDGRRVSRAEWAASKYFGNRAGFTGCHVRGPVSHLVSGPRARVFVAGTRHGNAPRGIQQGLVDG